MNVLSVFLKSMTYTRLIANRIHTHSTRYTPSPVHDVSLWSCASVCSNDARTRLTRHVFHVVHVVRPDFLGAGDRVRFAQQRFEMAHVRLGDAGVRAAVVAHVVDDPRRRGRETHAPRSAAQTRHGRGQRIPRRAVHVARAAPATGRNGAPGEEAPVGLLPAVDGRLSCGETVARTCVRTT